MWQSRVKMSAPASFSAPYRTSVYSTPSITAGSPVGSSGPSSDMVHPSEQLERGDEQMPSRLPVEVHDRPRDFVVLRPGQRLVLLKREYRYAIAVHEPEPIARFAVEVVRARGKEVWCYSAKRVERFAVGATAVPRGVDHPGNNLDRMNRLHPRRRDGREDTECERAWGRCRYLGRRREA